MTTTKKNKPVLIDVKNMSDAELDHAIDEALDKIFGKDESVPAEKPKHVHKKPSLKKPAPTKKPGRRKRI